jgi:hypothetical protein
MRCRHGLVDPPHLFLEKYARSVVIHYRGQELHWRHIIAFALCMLVYLFDGFEYARDGRQNYFSSTPLRKASHVFLSMTPSSKSKSFSVTAAVIEHAMHT